MDRKTGLDDATMAFNFILNSDRLNRYNTYNERCKAGKVYRTSNESLVSYMANVVKQDDYVLSVAASGDQYLSSILYGAKKADLFDINIFAYYHTMLKIVSASILSLEEFKSFLVGESPDDNFLGKDIYDKVSHYLPKRVKDYYDYLYCICGEYGRGNSMSHLLFSNDVLPLFNSCPYLFDGDYLVLQRLLRDKDLPCFMLGNITKILPRLNRNYDSMIFSNIMDYTEIDFEKKVYEDALPHLNDNGVVQLSYIWGDVEREESEYQDLEYDKYGIEKKVFPVRGRIETNNHSILLMRKK